MTETHFPQLVAHRGYLDCYPENTWLGLEAALRAGACWLEFDIQLCRDGEFILLHDADFMRTAGVQRSVFETDSTDTSLSVHEARRFGERFTPTPVSTLREVLQRLRAYPAVHALVEIKRESLDHWGLENVMGKLAPILAQQQPQCVLISYNDTALAWCREHYPAIPIGWVLQRFDDDHRQRAATLQADYLICNQRKIGATETPWRGDWQWMLYDIVDPDKALQWYDRDIALIETADIGGMLNDPRLAPGACQHGF